MVRGLRPGDPSRIGPYELTGVLGSGGMGQVFLGLSPGGRPVAVKVIRAELADDPEFRNRFRREVAAAQKVSGIFTAAVAGADADAPLPWLATVYVPGPSLAQAVAEHGPLPPEAVLALTAGLAEALTAIHAAGLVHRDLKPSNVLLAADGPRVIDFGISRAMETSALTHTGLVVGSPGFMSPEQAEGGQIRPASDVFSLGAVLTFAATGQGPFGGGMTAALVYRVVHAPPSLEQVPEVIRPLIQRCLDKDPARRPTPRDLLLATSTMRPAAGWLPEPVIGVTARDRLPGRPDEAHTATGMSGSAPPLATVQPQLQPGATVERQRLADAFVLPQLQPDAMVQRQLQPGSTAQPHLQPGSTAQPHLLPGSTAQPHLQPGSTAQPHLLPGSTAQPHLLPGSTAQPQLQPGDTAQRQRSPGAPVQPPLERNAVARRGHTAGKPRRLSRRLLAVASIAACLVVAAATAIFVLGGGSTKAPSKLGVAAGPTGSRAVRASSLSVDRASPTPAAASTPSSTPASTSPGVTPSPTPPRVSPTLTQHSSSPARSPSPHPAANPGQCQFGSLCPAVDGTMSGGAMTEQYANDGYTHVAGLNTPPAALTISIGEIPAAGTYTLTIFYENSTGNDGLTEPRDMNLLVNGSLVGVLDFDVTSSWYETASKSTIESVQVPSGLSTFSIACQAGNSCHVNLWKIKLAQ